MIGLFLEFGEDLHLQGFNAFNLPCDEMGLAGEHPKMGSNLYS